MAPAADTVAPAEGRTRVALVIPSLDAGGAERVTVNLANGLADAGHDVYLVVGMADGPFRAGVAGRVVVHELGARRFTRALIPLLRTLRSIRPDRVVSSLLPANVAAVAAWQLGARRTPAPVAWEHTVLSRHFATDATARRWHRPLVRWAYRRAAAVVAVSEEARLDLIEELGVAPEHVHVIDNPVITPTRHPAAQVPTLGAWSDGTGPVIAWVGRLERIKDPLVAIETLAVLRQRVPARMVMVGDGNLAADVDERITALGLCDAVHRTGFVPEPLCWMGRADVLLSTSLVEGLPTVFVEALSIGIPVVTTRSADAHEALLGGPEGPSRITPVGDPVALAEALAEVLAAGREEGRSGNSLLGQRFTVEAAVAAFERLLADRTTEACRSGRARS